MRKIEQLKQKKQRENNFHAMKVIYPLIQLPLGLKIPLFLSKCLKYNYSSF